MKKLILMLLIVAAAGISSYAQDSTRTYNKSRAGREKAYQQRKNQMDQLNLTQDQKDKMKKMREDSKVKREQIMNDKTLTADQRKAKLSELMKANRDERNSILTDEQKAKLKEMHAKKSKPVVY